jgi:hypothetical protein
MSWLLRKRKPSQLVTGANVRIRYGTFGAPNPTVDLVDVDASTVGIYDYHEGALFTPGAQNFVFEPRFELPLQTVWGFGFIRNPNTFPVFQHPQVMSFPHVQTNGIGGLQAGFIQLEPLIDPTTGDQGG